MFIPYRSFLLSHSDGTCTLKYNLVGNFLVSQSRKPEKIFFSVHTIGARNHERFSRQFTLIF